MKITPKRLTTALIFDRLEYFNTEKKEVENLKPVIIHPLHLFLLKDLDINPIISYYYKRYDFPFVKEISISKIENHEEILNTSWCARSFVQDFLTISDEFKREKHEGKYIEHLNHNNAIQEKLNKHLLDFKHFNNEPVKKVAFYKGCIEYFTWSLEKHPNNSSIESTLNLLKREKNSWENLIGKTKKHSQQNTVKGKKLNLLERYEIAKQVFNFESQIRTLNISEAEKHKVLGLILDCNVTNARHVMNGKYPGKIRKDLISEYIQDLKK